MSNPTPPITELRHLPRGARLRVEMKDGSKVAGTFHSIDGMYSYCTTDDGSVFHLKAWTPMVEINGSWEIADE